MRWILYQLADSAFPTGGFAHSAGLEAAVQLGEIRGSEGLERFVGAALWQTGLGALPFVSAGHARSGDGDERGLRQLDRACDAFLLGSVQNRASRTQGRAFVSTCGRIFPDEATVVRLDADTRERRIVAHLSPLFGAIAGALGASLGETQELALHLALRGVLSAAVRLGVVGPHEAQRLQRAHAATLDQVLAACADLAIEDAAQPAPVFDVTAQLHDHLYSRLFQS